MRYEIVRFRHNDQSVVREHGLTLEQARKHCSRPQTHGMYNPLRPGKGECHFHGIVDASHGDRCSCGETLLFDWFDGYRRER